MNGTAFGSRYVLGDQVGRGAMGRVYRAEVRDGGPDVAVKLLRDDLADSPEVVAQFIGERNLLLAVDHPNVVRVRDLVVDGGQLGIVMDLVRSGHLRRAVPPPTEPARAVGLMAQVADGLAAVHRAGVVHRDLKPENVLVAADQVGEPLLQITDFGIARLIGPSTTHLTTVNGTPGYLAPEVAVGARASSAADVYALGVMLFEWCVGRPPFVAESPFALLRAHAEDPAPRLVGAPGALQDLLDAVLTKQPKDRPSAAEVADRLRAVRPSLEGLQPFDVQANAVTLPPPVPSPVPSHSPVPVQSPPPASDDLFAAPTITRAAAVSPPSFRPSDYPPAVYSPSTAAPARSGSTSRLLVPVVAVAAVVALAVGGAWFLRGGFTGASAQAGAAASSPAQPSGGSSIAAAGDPTSAASAAASVGASAGAASGGPAAAGTAPAGSGGNSGNGGPVATAGGKPGAGKPSTAAGGVAPPVSAPPVAPTTAAAASVPGALPSMSLTSPTGTTLDLTWGGASGATAYRLGWTESGTGRVWSSNDTEYGASARFVTLIGLVPGHTYTVRITPLNAAGAGPTSTRTASTADAPSASTPSAVSSMSLSNPTGTTLDLAWGGATGATAYRLGWTESGTGRTWSSNDTEYGPSARSVTLIGLVPGHSYTVRVTPLNATGAGPTTTRTASTTG